MEKAETIVFYEQNSITNTQDKEMVINELMDSYSEKVYLLAYSFVKDQGMAEDIAQEVFIKCYKYLEKFRGDASIKSWIYRITVNTSKDFLKKRRFKFFNFPLAFFEKHVQNESSEDTYLKHNENEQILKFILSLPNKYSEIIILHYFHDLKIDEIGEVLGLNVNTVKTRLSRGRSILKDKMEEREGDA